MRGRGPLLTVRTEQPLEPAFAQRDVVPLDRVARSCENMFQLAQGDLLLLLVPRHRVRLFRQVRLQLLVSAEELEPLFVEVG